ncbi:hypothetical protein MJ8_26310 [Mesorhizobium sp. J8]|nr:hypothetical protein MJ8_26310 [Mesorhizobium sp. J8]
MRPPWSTRTPKHIPNNAPPTAASTMHGNGNGDLALGRRFFLSRVFDQLWVPAYSATSSSYSSKDGSAS